MKNLFKLKTLIILFVPVFIFSCSSDDDSSFSGGNIKYLTSVTGPNHDPTIDKYNDKDTLVYENGKLVKAYYGIAAHASARQFEYGDNGKISKIYDVDAYDNRNAIIGMFENSTIDQYDGSGYQIDSREYFLEYDSQDRLICFMLDKSHCYDRQYEYDNEGRLFKKDNGLYVVFEFDDKGNPLLVFDDYENLDIHYTYGDLKNPFYDLFIKFGYFEDSNSFYFEQEFISPNVVKSVEHRYSDTYYRFISDGDYPNTVQVDDHNGRRIYDFSYLN